MFFLNFSGQFDFGSQIISRGCGISRDTINWWGEIVYKDNLISKVKSFRDFMAFIVDKINSTRSTWWFHEGYRRTNVLYCGIEECHAGSDAALGPAFLVVWPYKGNNNLKECGYLDHSISVDLRKTSGILMRSTDGLVPYKHTLNIVSSVTPSQHFSLFEVFQACPM